MKWIENLENNITCKKKSSKNIAKICKNFQSFPSYNIAPEAIE